MKRLDCACEGEQKGGMKGSKKRSNLRLRGEWWTFRTKIDGREIWISLGTKDEEIAVEAAADLQRTIQAERLRVRLQSAGLPSTVVGDQATVERYAGLFEKLGTLRKSSELATIGEIVTAFASDAIGRAIADKSAKAYVSYLRRIVRTVHKTDDLGADNLRASVLTWQLLHDYQADAIAAAKPKGALELERALTTTFSAIKQARSVFSEAALQGAEMRKLKLPDLAEFMRFEPQGSTRKIRVEIDDATITRLRAASDDLWFNAPARWLAFACCGGLGLRRGEALRARWDWARQVGGRWVLYLVTTADGSPKGNEHKKEIEPSLWQDMTAVRQTGEFIIPGATEEERARILDENVQWLRSFGLDVDKPNHELRAIYLQALDRTHGRQAAQLGAGHSSARTTEIYTGRGTAPAVRSV